MPRGDENGQRGQGAGSGRGTRRRGGGGRGGDCICPNCGEKVIHQPGQPCFEQKCPKCGTMMTRG